MRAACGGMRYMCRGGMLMKDLYLYRWWWLYGVDTHMPADRQGHECTQLLINTQNMLPVSSGKPKIKSGHPQLHPLLKGNAKSLCIYEIPSSAFLLFLPQNLFFASLEGFLFCLALSAREKEQTRAEDPGSTHTWICSMIMYRGAFKFHRSICEPQHFPTVRGIQAIWKWGWK